MRRLFLVAVALLIALLGLPQAVAAAAATSVSATPAHGYDVHQHSVLDTNSLIERGPPTRATTYDAVDRGSRGASARPNGAAPPAITIYDHHATPVQVAGVTAAEGPALASPASPSSFVPSRVAANTATRTFGNFAVDDLRLAAQAADRNGLTQVGRALQKHSGRGTACSTGCRPEAQPHETNRASGSSTTSSTTRAGEAKCSIV